MKEIKRTVTVPKERAEEINRLLATEPASGSECFGEDETMSYTADFGDGIEMDIKLCGVQYEEGESNTPWTEAVLFDHGSELCCSEPDDTFFGCWELEHDDVKYIAEVVAEE